MNKGKIIVLEGACDGIGKTTQYKLLMDKLVKTENKVFQHHFPSYGTYQGMPVEKYLNGEFGNPRDLSPYFIHALYAMDRAITWNIELEEKYCAGELLLFDRYTTSSLIYQSALIEDLEERKHFIDYLTDYEYNKMGVRKPDIVIFLTAPFDLVSAMRLKREKYEGNDRDVYEKDLELMKKIYDGSMFVAKYLNWDIIECSDGNKMKSIEQIHDDIYSTINSKLLLQEKRQ